METRITSKGQVVIPAEVRRRRHLLPGQRFEVIDTERDIRLVPVRVLKIEEAEGLLKTSESARQLLDEARQKEKEREARLLGPEGRR